MRNSDPGVSIVSVQRTNSDLNSVLTVQATGCNFQYGSNFGVPLGSILLVVTLLRLLAKVYSRQAAAQNCENSAVSFVMKHCPILNNIQKSCIHTTFLNLSCCDDFSIRSPYCCNRRSFRARSSQSEGTSVLITLGTKEELDCPPTTDCSVLS